MKGNLVKTTILCLIAGLILSGSNEEKPKITMTTAEMSYILKIRLAGTGTVTVDWGDGESETLAIDETWRIIYHSVSSIRTVTITGANVTRLDCSYNRLIALDASENKALTYLHCGDNQLSIDALNALFGTLHGNAVVNDKTIVIDKNPGAAGCKKTIAEKKMWLVWNEQE